ncbi:hydrolase [Longispora fulva]|uniref:HAD superfamily hydrolase (TIGR01484 family) n=1 Tax=Longispora fulva TaxID=619741 RepID=A0A8J7KJR7_9ACTN|nr:HAD family hydrolase [Longispora fulva]MBG6135756.1 HAD superfamily hydrolase (TIGR01484 family) [Longispora fulva]GIG56003.1 hydrolase [Longispora fulva]
MTPPYRLVATDLDGTLLRSDGSLPAGTVEVLRHLRGRGVETVFVTARHPSAVLALDVPRSAVDLAIVCAGAAWYELPTGRFLHEQPLGPSVCAHLVHELRAAVPGVRFGWNTSEVPGDVVVEPGYFPAGTPAGWRTAATGSMDRPVLKLFARAPRGGERDFAAVADGLLLGRARIVHSTVGFVDLTRPDVSKVSALRALCSERGVSAAEVLAFGDAGADLEMLRWAGHGVAVANAEPEVRAVADAVAGDCDDEGVAAYVSACFHLEGLV